MADEGITHNTKRSNFIIKQNYQQWNSCHITLNPVLFSLWCFRRFSISTKLWITLFFQYLDFTNSFTTIPKKQISQEPYKGMHFYKDFLVTCWNWCLNTWNFSIPLCHSCFLFLAFPTDWHLVFLARSFSFLTAVSWGYCELSTRPSRYLLTLRFSHL